MSVRRTAAVINAELDLRMRFRYDDSGDEFNPFEVAQVQIIDAATGAILQTITSPITNIETGVYKITTSAGWNTTPRTIIDRWKFKKVSTSTYEYLESSCIIYSASVAPSETSIVTLAEVKTYLKLTKSDNDDLLNTLLGKCTRFIETLLNRILTQASYTELYTGDGSNILMLDNFPVSAVSILSEDLDFDTKKYSDAYSAGEYFLNSALGNIELRDLDFGTYQRSIYVAYTAGYSTVNMPPDLKLVVMNLIGKKYLDISQGRFGVTTRNVMTENVSFELNDISDYDKKIIYAYRKPPRKAGLSVSGWTAEA